MSVSEVYLIPGLEETSVPEAANPAGQVGLWDERGKEWQTTDAWYDQSSAAPNDATQGTSTKEPEILQVGGHPAYSYDGVDDEFDLASAIVLTDIFSVKAVIQRASVSAEHQICGDASTYISVLADGTTVRVRVGAANKDFTVPAIEADDMHVLIITRDSGNKINVYLDGAVSSTGELTGAGTLTIDNFAAGTFEGMICELGFWDRLISDDEITGTNTQLQTKWSPKPVFSPAQLGIQSNQGDVIKVTSSGNDGAGTLRQALADAEGAGSTIIECEVSHVFLRQRIQVSGLSTCTIKSTHANGTTILGGQIWIGYSDNVKLYNLRLYLGRIGDSDCLTCFRVNNLWVDRCAFAWGSDECVDFSSCYNVVFSRNILQYSHYSGNQALWFFGTGYVYGNLFGHGAVRPLLKAGVFRCHSNIGYNYESSSGPFSGAAQEVNPSWVDWIDNIVQGGPSRTSPALTSPSYASIGTNHAYIDNHRLFKSDMTELTPLVDADIDNVETSAMDTGTYGDIDNVIGNCGTLNHDTLEARLLTEYAAKTQTFITPSGQANRTTPPACGYDMDTGTMLAAGDYPFMTFKWETGASGDNWRYTIYFLKKPDASAVLGPGEGTADFTLIDTTTGNTLWSLTGVDTDDVVAPGAGTGVAAGNMLGFTFSEGEIISFHRTSPVSIINQNTLRCELTVSGKTAVAERHINTSAFPTS